MSLSEPKRPDPQARTSPSADATWRSGEDAPDARPMPRLLLDNCEAWDDNGTAELVRRVVAGEASAAAELVDLYQGRVFRLVRRMWSRDAQLVEDLTQEVFLRVFRALPRFGQECALGAWIHRITVNVCISELRKRKALKRDRATLSLDQTLGADDDGPRIEAVAETPAPGADSEKRELFDACRRAIAELPELWRVILTLRDLEGRSYEEIAQILDLPKGTVRSRLHRARARVRAKLEEGSR